MKFGSHLSSFEGDFSLHCVVGGDEFLRDGRDGIEEAGGGGVAMLLDHVGEKLGMRKDGFR